jgi:hypothetical protein
MTASHDSPLDWACPELGSGSLSVVEDVPLIRWSMVE